MKAVFLLTTVMFFFLGCSKEEFVAPEEPENANRMEEVFPGEIQGIYLENWISGVRGGGSGTNFFVELKQPLSGEVFLSRVYFRGQETKIANVSELLYVANFRNVVLDPEDLILNQDLSRSALSEPPIPIGYDEALIEYYLNGQLKYYVVYKLEERELSADPQ